MKIAIYDLDKTITRRPTYTPFLVFAAWRRAPWRLALLPLWIGAMLAHVLGLAGRGAIKAFGFRLMIGRRIAADELRALGLAFAERTCAANIRPGALERIAADKAADARLVLATAAPEFYAQAIGAALGFDAVIATRQARGPDGDYRCAIDGENCYGAAKLAMIEDWLRRDGLDRETAEIAFYSDHASDAPTLGWVDRGYVVNPARKLIALAEARGWERMRFA